MRHPRRTDRPPLIERLVEHGWSVMIFDGECVMCSGAVRFLAERSRGRLLAFSALQSKAAQRLLATLPEPGAVERTLFVVTPEGVLERSAAVAHLLTRMRAPWPLVARALRAVPERLRDGVYDLIVRNRFRVAGRRATCMLLDERQRRRFVL